MVAQTALFSTNIDNVFNQFVAVGNDRRGQTSLDGVGWTARTLTVGTNYSGIAFGKNVCCLCASNANTANMFMTSIDGAVWTVRNNTALGASIGWYGIDFGAGIFVAISGGAASAQIGTSTDTVNWTVSSPGGLSSVDRRCICFAAGKFVTLGYGSSASHYSTDGTTWSAGSGLPTGRWKSIAYDTVLAKYVAVSLMPLRVVGTAALTLAFTSGTKRITRSSGNFTTDTYFVGGTIVISGTASNNGTFTIAAVSTTTMDVNETVVTEGASAAPVITPINGSAYSTDGITWAPGSPTTHLRPSNWYSIASNDTGRVVAITNTTNSRIAAYSDDGINWTSIDLPLASTWGCIGYGNGRFVACTQSTTTVAYSDDDGVTWSLGPQGSFVWQFIKWVTFPFRTNDTLTIDRGATITVNTDQHAAWSAMTITNGTLRIQNTSTSAAIRFVTARTSGAAAQAITPTSGLGTISIEGNWIEIGTGDNTSGQELTIPYTDYVPCLWVETGVGTGIYEIWLNVSGAYGGTLKQYADGLLDVSTGVRGKFFTQTPNSTQDKYITISGTTTIGLFTVTLDSTAGIYQGASITGRFIPANTLVEQVVDGTTITINQQPTGTTTSSFRFFNPYSSQFTNKVIFGNNTNGNKLTSGVKVRIPNIMITSDTPANLHTSSAVLGTSFVLTAGGNVDMDTCLFDEAFHNFNQTQSLTITNVGMHTRPTITEVYDLNISSFGLGMPAVRRFNTANIWTGRDTRDTLTNGLLMNFITGAVIDDLAIVVQAPHAFNVGSLTAPTGMLNLANSDSITVSNIRMYSLNTTRAFQCGLAFTAPITNSAFDNIAFYGGPMMSLQFSSGNTFTNIINSETMFSFCHNYLAGMRTTFDPNTEAEMVAGTKYYFKSRTYFTRDRSEYTESRLYSLTPFKGSTNYPDYITAYCNVPQSVTFGWTHRTPILTTDTCTAANANSKQFVEIYRDTTPGFTPALSKKVAGLNYAPSVYIPTVVTWATVARTLQFDGLSVAASGGRTMTFDDGTKTIVASSGSFISDGFVIGDKVAVTGTSSNNTTFTITNVVALTLTVSETPVDEATSSTAILETNKITASSGSFITDGYAVGDVITPRGTASSSNNATFTINNVTATVINVVETIITQAAVSQFVSIVAKYTPSSKLQLTAAGGRTLQFYGLSLTAAGGRTFTFTNSNSRLTASTGNFSTEGYAVGDKVKITGTTNNNTTGPFLTVTAVAATILTFANDTIVNEGPLSATATITVNKVVASTGSFITDGYTVGDIVEVTGSANAGNNKVFTISNVVALTLNFIETAASQAAEAADAKLNVKHLPIPRVIFVQACPQRQLTFVKAQSSASGGRTFTFNSVAKTITASSGSFTTDGFVVGSKVVVTGSTYNNKVTLTLTTVTATVLTASAVLERQFDEVSTTAVLTANRITSSLGSGGTLQSWIADGFIIGDKITVTGTSGGTNDGVFTVNNVNIQYLSLAESVTTQTVVTANVLVTCTKQLTRQRIYFTPARTWTPASAGRTFTASSGSFLQDGYIVGDKVWIGGTVACLSVFTISTLTATVMTVLETVGSSTAIATNPITWTHTGQRPSFITTATITLVWTAATKTLTLGSGSFDGTYNFKVGDKLFITGQRWNNGMFTIATLPGAPASTTLTVTEPVIVDTTTYNATAGTISTIFGYHTTQKVTITAAAARIMTFAQATKSITLSGASAGSFIFDGYYVGDCVEIAGTTGSINNGYFTISALTATVMNVNELLFDGSETSVATISAPNIVNDTEYYYVVRKYDDTGVYNDSAEIYVKPTLQNVNTNLALHGTSMATSWTASSITVGAATRISPFVSPIATQTAEAVICTSTAAAGTLTQSVPTAVDNDYTLSVWVCTQPTILKIATITATGGRTLKFDSLSIAASGGRTMTFDDGTKTIVADSGSFITDGFAIGDKVVVTGTASNNSTFTVNTVVALTLTVDETPVDEATSSTAVLKTQKITASSGSFITDGHQIGDRILTTGATSTNNNGWFTITNVVATILNLSETVTTEAAYAATLTITNNYNDTLSIGGSVALGTTTTSFTATAAWQKVSATFTAAATTTDAVITITDNRRILCIIGACVTLGTSGKPYLTTTTQPVSNANEVRDIALARIWCRGRGEPDSHSGVELQLAAAVTGELWTEVYCGTTSSFTPSQKNKIFDTWAGSGHTIIFNQESSNNIIDGFTQGGLGAATNYTFAYFAAGSSNNKIKNVTYDLCGTYLTGLASFLTQSNDMMFYNWNISNWRNYATTVGNAMLFTTSNATSGLTVENLIMDNSDFPIQNLALNFIMKGVSGGNVKPLNAALLYNMPVTPTYVLGGGATNFDSIATTTPTVYTTVYDTIFHEAYFTETTGALDIIFNASAKVSKPYVLTGSAAFSNQGRLFLTTAGSSAEYTWLHKIIGVSGFQNVPLLLNGVDLGSTPSLLQGVLVEYKIDTGAGYPGSWTTANPANLSAEVVDPVDGFFLKLKITAKYGMKYASAVKNFVVGETIRGLSSQATAVVDEDFDLITQGTLWLSSVAGLFLPGEVIVKDSNGELRATNVATNTNFAEFPSFTSYIDGLQIYTTVDQSALYPPEQQTLTLTGLQANSEVRILEYGTTNELDGIESSGTSFEYSYTYVPDTHITIIILHLDWNYYRIEDYVLSSADGTIPISQITDRVYSN